MVSLRWRAMRACAAASAGVRGRAGARVRGSLTLRTLGSIRPEARKQIIRAKRAVSAREHVLPEAVPDEHAHARRPADVVKEGALVDGVRPAQADGPLVLLDGGHGLTARGAILSDGVLNARRQLLASDRRRQHVGQDHCVGGARARRVVKTGHARGARARGGDKGGHARGAATKEGLARGVRRGALVKRAWCGAHTRWGLQHDVHKVGLRASVAWGRRCGRNLCVGMLAL